jgi:hypothetical protein
MRTGNHPELANNDLDSALILPVQFYDMLHRRHILEGEFKLMFAVLEDAIHCYLKNMKCRTNEERDEFFEVKRWLETRANGRRGALGLFAFENLCDALGIEPGSLRKRLSSLHETHANVRHFRRSHSALGGLVQPRVRLTGSHAV